MQPPTAETCLIRNAAGIMTGLAGAPARHPGPDIRIRGPRIEAIGALVPLAGENVIDASGCMVYPAWINTHHHLAESLLKGLPAGINCSLSDWLAAVPLASGPHPQNHAVLIEANALLFGDIPGFATRLEYAYRIPFVPDPRNSSLVNIHTEPELTGLHVNEHYYVPKIPVPPLTPLV